MKWWFRMPGAKAESGAPEGLLEQLEACSGYAREAAVVAVQRRRYAAAIGRLLLRANDWVPEVRVAAQRALRSMLDAAHLRHWTGALEAVVALARGGRSDHGPLLEDITAFLGQPDCLPAVQVAAEGASDRVRRFVFDIAWRRATAEGRLQLLRAAIPGPGRMQARMAASLIERLPDERDRAELAAVACSSPFSPVRAQGLRILAAGDSGQAQAHALRMCLDLSTTVRAVAWAQVMGSVAAATVVARAHEQFGAGSAAQKRAALELLLVAAPESALELCQQALDSQHPMVRGVALAALLGRSDDYQKEALLLRGLRDPSGKVQQVSARTIARGAAAPEARTVLNTALAHGTLPALARGFAVLSRVSPWERLACLLDALDADLPPGGSELCLQELRQWEWDIRRSFLPLPAALRTRLEPAWQRHSAKVPGPLRLQVDFHLQH